MSGARKDSAWKGGDFVKVASNPKGTESFFAALAELVEIGRFGLIDDFRESQRTRMLTVLANADWGAIQEVGFSHP